MPSTKHYIFYQTFYAINYITDYNIEEINQIFNNLYMPTFTNTNDYIKAFTYAINHSTLDDKDKIIKTYKLLFKMGNK